MKYLGSDRRHWPDRRQLLHCSGAAIAVLLFRATKGQAAEPAGAVDRITGEAFADAKGHHRTLERSSPLFIKDQVATGRASRLTMHLGRDTTVQLGEKARVVIDRFLVNVGGVITLQSGPMLFDRPAGSSKVPMRIRSAYALIAVRGTRFFAGPSKGVFGVFVERGTVTVSGGGREVTLRPGQGTNIVHPGSKPTTPVVWGEARIRAAFDSVR
jgi:hypothetical protein